MSCPCDRSQHPVPPNGPSDGSRLRRAPAGARDYARVLYSDAADRSPLDRWRVSLDGPGRLLLDLPARLLATLGAYDESLAGESYLRTAQRAVSIDRLLQKLAYAPAPATAASSVVAALASEKPYAEVEPVVISADGDESQIFETEPLPSHVNRNSWRIGRVLDDSTTRILVDAGLTRVAKGLLVMLGASASPPSRTAARIIETKPYIGRDGVTYLELHFDTELETASRLPGLELLAASLSTRLSPFAPTEAINTGDSEIPIANLAGPSRTQALIDIQPSSLERGASVIVALAGSYHVGVISEVVAATAQGPGGVQLPMTRVELVPPIPWLDDPSFRDEQALRFHYNLVPIGRLAAPARVEIGSADLAGPGGVPLVGPIEPLAPGLLPSEVILEDAHGRGALAKARIEIDQEGDGRLFLQDAEAFAGTMRAPITVYGNVLHATRGETVADELLGSGDGSIAFQTFELARSPLTYLRDPQAPRGVRSTLEVRVDGFAWREVASFFGAGPEDRVYIVRHDEGGATRITFGDGVRGARLPSGVDNVAATYRHGAGAAKPQAGALRQLVRPVPGIRRVVSPVAPWGGSDAESMAELRRNAPASALTLGRAVSIPDFEALARSQPSVINARAAWAWDTSAQRAAVRVWIVSDGATVAADVAAFLAAQAGPDVPIAVAEAELVPLELAVEVAPVPGHDPARVRLAVIDALVIGDEAPLALANAPIGQHVFRSHLTAAIHGVDGVESIRSLTRSGAPMPLAVPIAAGQVPDARGLVIDGQVWPAGGSA